MPRQYEFHYVAPKYAMSSKKFTGWGSQHVLRFSAENNQEAESLVEKLIERQAKQDAHNGYPKSIKPIRITLTIRQWTKRIPRLPMDEEKMFIS